MASTKTTSLKPAKLKKRAVIDIGSNSVRLVIYDGPARAPLSICNEKALCGLGRDMTEKGRLNPNAVSDAMATLVRFQTLLAEHGNPPTYAFATAAMRTAKDGESFIKSVRELGIDVSIISGEEEADLAALGVLSFDPVANGIVGDMGGGSLELVAIKKNGVGDKISLPIGPLSLMQQVGNDLQAAKKIVEKELDSVSFLQNGKTDTLYAVGGAWRAIARIHMRLRSYPLSVLHRYELTTAQAYEICDLVSGQSRRSLEEIPGIPKRRIDTLPFASAIMKLVLQRMSAKRVIVSAGGVREGLLYRQLGKADQSSDPFIEACHFYAEKLSPSASRSDLVKSVYKNLFKDGDEDKTRLRLAASILLDIGAFFHPDLRGRHAFDTVMRIPFAGVNHKERIWTALALYRRHQGRTAPLPDEQAISILNWEDQQSATEFGLALRFIGSFAPKASALLKGCALHREDGNIIFEAPEACRILMGETPRKRIESLAAFTNANVVERYY